jgi:hypothetical protein
MPITYRDLPIVLKCAMIFFAVLVGLFCCTLLCIVVYAIYEHMTTVWGLSSGVTITILVFAAIGAISASCEQTP